MTNEEILKPVKCPTCKKKFLFAVDFYNHKCAGLPQSAENIIVRFGDGKTKLGEVASLLGVSVLQAYHLTTDCRSAGILILR